MKTLNATDILAVSGGASAGNDVLIKLGQVSGMVYGGIFGAATALSGLGLVLWLAPAYAIGQVGSFLVIGVGTAGGAVTGTYVGGLTGYALGKTTDIITGQ